MACTSIQSLWRLLNRHSAQMGTVPPNWEPLPVLLPCSFCLPQQCLQLQILLVHLYALNWCEIMALAEYQRMQRVMLSDTNCSLILSGGVLANLQSTPKWGLWWRGEGERGRDRELTDEIQTLFVMCLFIFWLCANYQRISCPPPPLEVVLACSPQEHLQKRWKYAFRWLAHSIIHKVDFEITAIRLKSKLLDQAEITT